MKILHINSYYTGRNFYKNFYEKQKENKINISVYVPVSSSKNIEYTGIGSYTTVSVTYNKYDRFIFYLKHFKIYKDMRKKYNITDYSIMHAHSLFSNGYIALKAKEEFDIEYIVAVRNTDVNIFFRKFPFLRPLAVNILLNAKYIVFLSSSYKEYVIEKYIPSKYKEKISGKSVIIPNGIDSFWFNNIGKSRKISENSKLRLLYIGDINKNKNIITTTKAIEILIKSGYEVEFTVIGKVKDPIIFEQIKKLPYLKFIPPLPKESLVNIYRNSDIFVMPSLTETFGLVYAEAMSQGLPVIYSKGQGFDRQFKEGLIGYHVNSLDPKDIAEKILEIINNYNEISINCIKNAEKFKWGSIIERYEELYGSEENNNN